MGPPGPAGADGADGAPGADGADGAPGADGADGVSVTSTPLASGNANCPNGGSSFTSATGVTYACTGEDGASSAPAAAEGTGASGPWIADGGVHHVAIVVTSSRSLVTGLASISFLPADSGGVPQAITVRCAIADAGGTEIGGAMVGSPTGAFGGIVSLTAQGFSGAGQYDLVCQRVSASGQFYVLSPKLTAVATS